MCALVDMGVSLDNIPSALPPWIVAGVMVDRELP